MTGNFKGTAEIDEHGRVLLPTSVVDPDAELFHVYLTDEGHILLEPCVTVPLKEYRAMVAALKG
mgnify:CR=1 FL=1